MGTGTTNPDTEQKRKTATLLPQKEQVGVIIIGGHFQGLGLLRNLARHNVPTYLLHQNMCIARFSRYAKRFSKCPDVRTESLFLEFLMDLARKENLKGWMIYPNDDEMVRLLARHKEQLEEYYRVTTPPWDIVKLAYEKILTYKLAEECGIAIPRTFYPRNAEELEQLDLKFPVIIKPSERQPFLRIMQKKAILVDNMSKLSDEYAKAIKAVDSNQLLMVQELIPGGPQNLFSVGSLCRSGKLLARVVVRRPRQWPMDFGRSSTFVETVDIPELEDMTSRILGAMGYCGLSEVEFMFDTRDGEYKFLEINARPWGWHTIAIGAGVELPYLSYLDMLGENVRQDGFITGVKWFRLLTDVPTAMGEVLKGRMKITDYFKSLSGKKQYAVISMRDPLPFIMEFLMLPYLWKKRGS